MAKEKKENIPTIKEGDLHSLLHEYREIAGYSLTQMAEALCLSSDSLVKLENEDFQGLAEPPYVRGYLRNYAKVADKDPAELINIYEKLRGANPDDLDYHFKEKPKILTESKRTISPVMGQLLLLSLLLAFLVGISMIPAVNKWIINTWNSFSQQTNTQHNSGLNNQDLIGTMPIPQPLPIEDQTASVENKAKQNKQAETKPADSSTPETADNKVNESKKPVSANEQTVQADSKQATHTNNALNNTDNTNTASLLTPEALAQNGISGDTINIKLIFNSEVWMRIKDKDNKTVFEGLNTMGGSKSLTLTKPLHFRVGNAQGLSLFVDDQALDISAHIRGSVAKFTLK